MHQLISAIWDKEQLPEQWKTGLVFPIYKKGDKLECSNYRGITLLNVAYKILSSVILSRLKGFSEEAVGEYQAGFRRNRSTVDQIFTLRQAMEKCYEYNTDLHMLFVDFKQAFDSINRKKLLEYLSKKGLPTKMCKLIKMVFEGTKAKVLVGGKTGEHFHLQKGVRQGDALSATLFNLALQQAVDELNPTGHIIYKRQQVCAYADDILLMSRSVSGLKDMHGILSQAGKLIGLEVNVKKTKYLRMTADERRRALENLTCGDLTFEAVENFVYLGASVNNSNKTSDEIQRRIMAGNRAYHANQKLFKSSIISKSSKMKIYKTLIRPVVAYGSETWNITNRDAERLRILERKIIRKIMGPVQEEGEWRIRSNREIEEYLEDGDIVRFVKASRIRWAGHVERMTENRIPKLIFRSRMDGRRLQGRPRNRWADELLRDLRQLKVKDWKRVAKDREQWKEIVREAKVHKEL